MLKLFDIDYMDDCDDEHCLMVAESEEVVREKFEKEVYSGLSCPMAYFVHEITEIDGHKIIVE